MCVCVCMHVCMCVCVEGREKGEKEEDLININES